MRVLDFKDTSRKSIRAEHRLFRELEKKLVNCSTLEEQRFVLNMFYETGTFKRDALVLRRQALLNRMSFGLKETILSYINLMIAFFGSVFTLYLDKILFDNPDLSDWVPRVVVFISIVAGTVVLLCLRAFGDKVRYIQKDVPLLEILDFELDIIEKALASEKNRV